MHRREKSPLLQSYSTRAPPNFGSCQNSELDFSSVVDPLHPIHIEHGREYDDDKNIKRYFGMGRLFQTIPLLISLAMLVIGAIALVSHHHHHRFSRIRASKFGMMALPSSNNKHHDSFDDDMIPPKMIVLDLDATIWLPDTWNLTSSPSIPVVEHGIVTGLMIPPSGPTVQYCGDALEILQMLYTVGLFGFDRGDLMIAATSSARHPVWTWELLHHLEVEPGVPLATMFEYTEIGRTGRLSTNKTTHFQALHDDSGMPYEEMLYFDDCWGSDHVKEVYDSLGVIGQRTPNCLTWSDFKEGLRKFDQQSRMKPPGI